LLKELVIAIESFFGAHRFISKHNLWRWIIIPGVIYTLLFVTGIYFFWITSSSAVTWLLTQTGISNYLNTLPDIFKLLFVFGQIMLQLVLLFFYFSIFKYVFLIIGSPVFAYLSEKTESIIEGKDFPFSLTQLLKDIARGVKIAMRNLLWQTVYTISVLLLSLIPVVGWLTPLVSLLIECYYLGFSMLDYNCERNKLNTSQSIAFVGKHKGLAIGNGLCFYTMHLIPVVGWVLAPSYAVVAATLSLYKVKKQPLP
jgi:CysZ protein